MEFPVRQGFLAPALVGGDRWAQGAGLLVGLRGWNRGVEALGAKVVVPTPPWVLVTLSSCIDSAPIEALDQ